jgi:hypothetical protein
MFLIAPHQISRPDNPVTHNFGALQPEGDLQTLQSPGTPTKSYTQQFPYHFTVTGISMNVPYRSAAVRT